MTLIVSPDGSRRVNSARGRGKFRKEERDALVAGIRRGIADGQSDLAIAAALGIANRTVNRYRARYHLPNFYGATTRRTTTRKATP